MADGWRPAWADIDLAAVEHNASLLARLAHPAALCAVVKADGYGHGALAVAEAAIGGGATWLAVALVEEGVALRDAGVDAPILLLSEPPVDAMAEAVVRRLVPTVYTSGAVDALDRAAAAAGGPPVAVHLKVDTGMHRVGADVASARAVAERITAAGSLRPGALWTHLAVADGAEAGDHAYTELQLDRFATVEATLAEVGIRFELTHAANTAGTIAYPRARRDLVRCGLGLYGLAPSPPLAARLAEATGGQRLAPVLSLRSQVTFVRELEAGERPSYGRRRPLEGARTVATVPVGYADGVPRRLYDCGGEVLVGGIRRPLAGVVTMDQIVVECGPPDAPGVEVGDEVVLLGRQGDAEITADEWADLLGTISYEVLCDIGPRVPRRIGRSSGPAA